ncbi:toll/interleukin-1 receptor domain-containing protein [Actinoplanes sp. NPDC051851]|uniref:toll/interleukin-1 receptor domain-containing protein n=1 Tax=Actinoplanes sp. NPDC051851 TaxID=3154753 RepID=UPI00343DB831
MVTTSRRALPPPPVFFVSYARPPGRPPGEGGRLTDPMTDHRDFFADLKSCVNQLLPIPAGHPVGFMDTGLEAGARWTDELLLNLAGCRVFIALLSARYVQLSAWCPMEWDYFARRSVRSKPNTLARPNATAIIPVLWAPVAAPMPPMVARIQRFTPPLVVDPQHRLMYESEGVLGMQQLDRSAYTALVWTLAREVQNVWANLEVQPSARRTTTGLIRSFPAGA